ELQNVLEFDDDPGTADRIILSFALHLFPAGQELELLKRCARAAGKGVIVIDHPTGWHPFLALVEAAEGSWYGEYRRVDFAAAAAGLGVRLKDHRAPGIRVLEFEKLGPTGPDSAASAG
ncbi:MAG TPA: hypothetical protein VMC79_02645, partial [Rectinemataceae bacterium]|nr:hypothetical protein [Rectinemataceae bacterium]